MSHNNKPAVLFHLDLVGEITCSQWTEFVAIRLKSWVYVPLCGHVAVLIASYDNPSIFSNHKHGVSRFSFGLKYDLSAIDSEYFFFVLQGSKLFMVPPD